MFDTNYDATDDDDETEKPTFTVQPTSSSLFSIDETNDITPKETRNKYAWSVNDKHYKSSSFGKKNIAEWIDDELQSGDGKTRNGCLQNWSKQGLENEDTPGDESGNSDSELLAT